MKYPLIFLNDAMRCKGNYYENDTYDALLWAANELFPKCVKREERHIVINDQIVIEMSLSFNETKVYFRSYQITKELAEKINDSSKGIYWDFHKLNTTFRLFGLETMIEYLKIKYIENEFIKQFEG